MTDENRYGKITKQNSGDYTWNIWGNTILVKLSESSEVQERYDPEDHSTTSVSYVPIYLDGENIGSIEWWVSQQGINDLLSEAQMLVESFIQNRQA